MRRLPRILLNAATAVSLVLCLAISVLRVRSYRYADSYVAQPADNRQFAVAASRGVLLLARLAANPPAGETFYLKQPAGWTSRENDGSQKLDRSRGFLGFRWQSEDVSFMSHAANDAPHAQDRLLRRGDRLRPGRRAAGRGRAARRRELG